jgi:CRP/FNR family transcriptional regulator, cyclic AMP receptor protein
MTEPNHPPTENLSLLKELQSIQELQDIADRQSLGLEPQHFPAGQQIFNQGDPGDLLYVLLRGQVQITVDQVPLADLSPGACFGEMALFDAQPRSATATALVDCDCLTLSAEQLHNALQRFPKLSWALLQVLGQRLRHLNQLFLATEELFCLHPKSI